MSTAIKSRPRSGCAPKLPKVSAYYFRSGGLISGTQDHHDKGKRQTFVPVDSPVRFEWVQGRWSPGDVPEGYDRDKLTEYVNTCQQPRSWVDVPDSLWSGGECAPPAWMTRAAAFAEVAKLNREQWEKQNGRVGLGAWHFVVELGKCQPCGYTTMDIAEGGTGEFSVVTAQPIRVVLPTAAEFAEYAVRGGEA